MSQTDRPMLRRLHDATWGRAFAVLYDKVFARAEEAGLRDIRRATLSPATGRTLEIGAGTGLNHELYPAAVTELVMTEPFGPMADQLRERVSASGTDVVQAPGDSIPLPDNSFDTVTCTLVLCTADDPDAVLREIARLLKPGGRFLFVEHVRSQDPGLAKWQDRLHGPWWVFAHGCHCNRDTRSTIEDSPLTVETVEDGELPKLAPLVRPLISGAARLAG
jgi:ubiquinone/menaquinone biosynthesis C-methylase UbiE